MIENRADATLFAGGRGVVAAPLPEQGSGGGQCRRHGDRTPRQDRDSDDSSRCGQRVGFVNFQRRQPPGACDPASRDKRLDAAIVRHGGRA
jgi:hypothetical protein